jgi:hypothetical protein
MSDISIPASALATVGATNADEFFVILAKNCVNAPTDTTMTEARIREIASAAGSAEAAKALGACGVTPPAPPSLPLSAAVRTAAAKRRPESQQAAQSTYAEQFAASKELQDEFSTVEVYVAFMKANRAGQIRIIN